MGTTNDPEKLRDAVKGRRARLRLKARDAASLGAVPLGTWSAIEQARSVNPTPMTLGGIDEAMQWPAMTAYRVLRGELAPVDAVNLATVAELGRPQHRSTPASNGSLR
jgi:hypothetical protein